MTNEATPELRTWLKAIGSITTAVNAERDLKSLLDLITATAHDLLDLSFCAVMLPDDEEEYLSVAGASGLPDQYIARVNRDRPVRIEVAALEGAPASRAFRTGKPSMVSDMALEASSRWADLARQQGYQSILAVPLLSGTRVVGTLNSYRTTAHHFLPSEVEQLELLAEHATIALTSARIVEDLRDKHRMIVRSEEIHARLLGIAMRSGGVAGITSALHDLLGSIVVIVDAHGTLLAEEPQGAGDEHAPNVVPRTDDLAASAPGLVREVGKDVAADVMLSGSNVATVWLPGKAGRLDALGIRALEHASVVLSLELLRQRTAAEVEQTLRGELLADLLAGADPMSAPIRDRAALMGHDLSITHWMSVATTRGGTPSSRGTRPAAGETDAAQRSAAEAVRLTSHLRPKPLIASVRGAVVALWPEAVDIATAEQALRRATTLAVPGSVAAVAATKLDGHGIPAAYRGARGALAFAATEGETHTVVTLDKLGAAGLLLQFAEPDELHRYAQRTIGTLRSYDRDHGAELLKTLRTYLDHDLDRRATGDVLVLHPNTVSQRLRRVETLTGLNLRSPRSVIEARTALMLTDVADALSGLAE